MSETTGGAKKRDWFSIFLMVACLALAVLVVLLAWENRKLKMLTEVPQIENAIEVGDILEPFTLMDDAGGEYVMEYGGGTERTLLMVFSSQCPACEETLPLWSELTDDLMSVPGLQIAAVQLDRQAQGGAESPVMPDAYPFPIYSVDVAGTEFVKGKRIPSIPTTLVADAGGVITLACFEKPGDEVLEELRRVLGG